MLRIMIALLVAVFYLQYTVVMSEESVLNLFPGFQQVRTALQQSQNSIQRHEKRLQQYESKIAQLKDEISKIGTIQTRAADIALAFCKAVSGHSWTSAVPRICHREPNCHTVCSRASARIIGTIGEAHGRTARCTAALKVYDNALNPNNAGRTYPSTYRYGDCSNVGCGPNFCCCNI